MVSSRRNLGFQATSRCPQVSNKMSSIQKAPNAPTKSKGRLGIFAAKPGGTEFSWLGGRDLCASFGCTVFLSWSVEMHEICDLGSTRLQEHAILWHAWLFPLALNVGIECIGRHEVVWSRTAKSNTPPADPHANWPLHVAGLLTARATLRCICMRKLTPRIESKRSKCDQILHGYTWPYLVPSW